MNKIIAISFATLLNLTCTAAFAQEQTIKYAYNDVDQPESNGPAAFAYVFKEALERLSGGKIKVDIYPNSQLGDAKSLAQQVRRGTVEFASFSSGVFASLYYPKLGILDLPYLYSSRSDMLKKLSPKTSYMANLIDDVAARTGVRILGFEPNGFRHFTTADQPIHSPGDMKGLKMRTQEITAHQEMMRTLGASPTPIPFMELYSALQTGVVDGQENPLVVIQQQKYYQVQHYVTLSGHLMTIAGVFVNDDWYQELSDDLRHAVDEAQAEASLAYSGVSAVQDMLALKELQDEGMEVYAPPPEELDEFRQATVAPVRKWAVNEYGKTFVDTFFDYIDSDSH